MENFTLNNFGLGVQPFDHSAHGDNCGHEWKKWMHSFELCMKANCIVDLDRKAALLLHFAGQKVQEIFQTLPEPTPTRSIGPLATEYVLISEYEKTTQKLNAFFLSKTNIIYERHLFRQLHQNIDENIEIFAFRLRLQAERCEFGEGLETSIKEVLISNCDEALRKDLMKLAVMKDINLESLLKSAKGIELVNKQLKKIRTSSRPQLQFPTEEINQITIKPKFGTPHQKWKKPYDRHPLKEIECYRCGNLGHIASDKTCPAKNEICSNCYGKGHLAIRCRSVRRKSIQWKRPSNDQSPDRSIANKRVKSEESVKFISENNNDDYVFGIDIDEEFCDEFDPGNQITCTLGGVQCESIIDSGSKRNLLGQKAWKLLKSNKITLITQQQGTNQIFKTYGGRLLTMLGIFEATVEVSGIQVLAKFYVTKEDGPIILGRITAYALKILKIGVHVDVHTIENENNNNQILGCIKGLVIDIPIKNNVKPVMQPYRRIPVALEKVVDRKINELLQQDIIEKVNSPSRWISPVVLTEQKDDYRFCIDMRRANQAIEREIHPLPTIEEFLPHLGGSTIYSKLDVRQAFHQVLLSERSREITTFITNNGLYRYKRLMFGITCAPEFFQKIMQQILSGCEGCLNFIDDILIHGKTKEDHDKKLQKVLKKLSEHGVTLRKEKCVIGVDKVEFLGHILSSTGIKPKMDKIEAVKHFREPTTTEEVRSFLGLVNYVGRFIPNLATISEPLRFLTKKNISFNWQDVHRQAFTELKDLMTNDMALGFYNINDRTQVYADASPVGLGAVLVQIGSNGPRVISYANKSLSDVEKRYAQTEKEALALVWSIERFHFYLYGREFDLITDHKPLEVIFGPKSKPCARIERWVLRLQSYKYRIIYKPGKNNIADPLSRLITISDTTIPMSFDNDNENYVNWIVAMSTPVALKLKEIEESSIIDDEIQNVKRSIYDNYWTEETKLYKIFETELCFAGAILLRGHRIIMPKALRERTIELAHEGHPGVNLMKRRLRTKVWWPKMDEQVEKYVKKCRGCQLVSAPSAPEPLRRKELPSAPWQHLAIDYMGPLPTGHNLFVIVDYFSRYMEIEIMINKDAPETIQRLNTIFARFGLPLTITLDNAKQFIGKEMEKFCKMNNIELNNTIPYWPQQNGEVERQNRSILKRLQIAHLGGKDWREELSTFLLMYHSTPHSTTLKTPSELMFGRNIRDKLPSIYQPLETDESVRDRDKEQKEKEKRYADERRHAKTSDIREGDQVVVKNLKKVSKLTPTFNSATHHVVEKRGSEAVVEDDISKKRYRRNVAHLKKFDEENKVETIAHIEEN